VPPIANLETLRASADALEALHRLPGQPLVLANAWDAASARLVAEAGAPAIATSSRAVAASLGFEDSDSMGADAAFAAVSRIACAVALPVTADLEAGYGLEAGELVDRLLAAGAGGCNLEDTDHHGDGVLVDPGRQAERIHSVRLAAAAAGVDVVLNARTDVYLREFGEQADRLAETLQRGRRYLEAGASCVYPIGMAARDEIAAAVGGLDGPVNIWLRPGTPSVTELAELGVARISVAAALHRASLASARSAAEALYRGDASALFVSPPS
jgi:2-methylisocitrate lyase-like PEP mutase family enzyme